MNETNYARQLVKQILQMVRDESIPIDLDFAFSWALKTLPLSTKFQLPDGGLILDDKKFNVLSQCEKIGLPYDYLCIEYQREKKSEAAIQSSKAIVLASQNKEAITILSFAWWDELQIWAPVTYLPITIMRDDFISDMVDESLGRRMVKVYCDVDPKDSMEEVVVLLNMLTALSCSNVEQKTIPARLHTKKRSLEAIPFDEYRVLVIKKSSESQKNKPESSSFSFTPPREHLRRGHIRRLESGRFVWVNAAVVNPGVGGRLTKNYKICT